MSATDYLASRRSAYNATTQGEWWATEALDADEDAAYGISSGPTDDGTMVFTTPGSASFDGGEEEPERRTPNCDWAALAHNDEPKVLAVVQAVAELLEGCDAVIGDERGSMIEVDSGSLASLRNRLDDLTRT